MKRKPFAALILAQMKKSGKSDKSSDESYDSSNDSGDESMEEGLNAASEEILSAVSDGDAGALKSALKSFIEQC